MPLVRAVLEDALERAGRELCGTHASELARRANPSERARARAAVTSPLQPVLLLGTADARVGRARARAERAVAPHAHL